MKVKDMQKMPLPELQIFKLKLEKEIRNRRIKNVMQLAANNKDLNNAAKKLVKDLEKEIRQVVRIEAHIDNTLEELEIELDLI